ncbi:hypothetical protein [Vibrio fortis]|jgi:hypothetical protein|uniref:hypothetical protein n=1 Tax=Vibrio fortis TaxID=212667 RepID=UPI0038CD4E09|tara:strand:- start:2259 stop:3386 length:1128 start_codon:yes stop_codon:yes gene_type:complete
MFKEQNVFFITKNDRFFYLYADALIHKANTLPEKIKAVVFDCIGDLSDGNFDKVPGVDYLNYDESMLSQLEEARTITFMSLNQVNSTMVRKVIDHSENILRKTYIFLTDDEIDRWHHSIEKYGGIVPSKKLAIAKDDIYVTERIVNFIGHEKTFYNRVTSALGRNDINFVDAGVIFDTLPNNIITPLNDAILKSEQLAGKERKILIGTKQKSFNLSEIRSMLFSLCQNNVGESYKILIMWHKKHRKQRMLLDLYITWLRHIKRQTIDISYVTALSPVAYTSLISSCSHIVLQRRGGASTVRSYLKLGKGIICIPKSSENEFGFKDALGLDIVSFESTDELILGILNSKIDVLLNAEKTIAEEKRSIGVLKVIYSS